MDGGPGRARRSILQGSRKPNVDYTAGNTSSSSSSSLSSSGLSTVKGNIYFCP